MRDARCKRQAQRGIAFDRRLRGARAPTSRMPIFQFLLGVPKVDRHLCQNSGLSLHLWPKRSTALGVRGVREPEPRRSLVTSVVSCRSVRN
jgi:hypothetical protein